MRTMNNEMNPVETNADVERACVVAILDQQIDSPRHRIPSKDERANYNSDADVKITIDRIKNQGLHSLMR